MSRPKPPLSTGRGFFSDPVVLGVLVINLAVILLTVFPLLSPNATYVILESYVLIPISILGMIAPWVGLPSIRNPRERLFWALWSLSLGFHLVLRVTYVVLPDVDYLIDGSLLVDLLYVLFYLPLILSVLVRPDQPIHEGDAKEPRALEFGGTGVFILAVVTYFILIPRAFNTPEYESWIPSYLMYWVFDAFLLLSLFYLRETAPSRDWRILYSWLAVAPACWVITELLEMTLYVNPYPAAQTPSYLDGLWYLPWIAITLAGRMRTQPFPAVFATGHRERDETELSRSLGRPGWLQVAALGFLVVHMGATLLRLLDPETRDAREVVVLVAVVLLLGMASLHQKLLEARALALIRRGQELEERERLLVAAVEQSPEAVLIADAQGVVRYANQSYAELNGGVESVIGAPLMGVLPEGLSGTTEGNPIEELARKLAADEGWEGRTGVGGPEAGEREEVVTVSPVRDPEGTVIHWVLIRRDVTYLNQLERQFRQAQRMEAVGALAGGIAKEFEDLVDKIYGYGDFLRSELGRDSQPYHELLGVLTAAEKAGELVRQVLAFGRGGGGERRQLVLGNVVMEALSLLRPTIPASVRLQERIRSGESATWGVRHQIHQLVLNLGSNAIHAMEREGGTLTVGVENVVVDGAESRDLGLPRPGDYLLLFVRDDGSGMDRSTVGQIFDPFFTTKGPRQGTGLGLFLVRETVASHGGVVRVESRVGSGTLVRVFLPKEPRAVDRDEAADGAESGSGPEEDQ